MNIARRSRPQPRGMAMMLVLISLLMGTILATAYVSARDNSAAIGKNVACATEARWAAASGLELATAIVEMNDIDWRTSSGDGVLLDNYMLGNASLHIDIADLETGQPPTDETTKIGLVVHASIDGVEQTAVGTACLPANTGSSSNRVDLDLSEFIIFAADTISLTGDAVVARWPAAPAAVSGDPIAFGTQGVNANTVWIHDNAAAIDTTVYHSAGASPLIIGGANSSTVATSAVSGTIGFPDPKPPSVIDAGVALTTKLVAGLITQPASGSYTDINVLSGVYGIADGVTLVSESDLEIHPGAAMFVQGDAELIVLNDLIIQPGGYIELAQNASLEIFVFGDVTIRDGFVGEVRADKSLLDNSGEAKWIDPERVRISSMKFYRDDSGTIITAANQTWSVSDQSVVTASFYAPAVSLAISDFACMYGRAAVKDIALSENAAMFYDPALNPGVGYMNPTSLLYDASSVVRADIAAVASMAPGDLASLASTYGLFIETGGATYGTPATKTAVVVGVSDPTPRTNAAELNMSGFGTSIVFWENPGGTTSPFTLRETTSGIMGRNLLDSGTKSENQQGSVAPITLP